MKIKDNFSLIPKNNIIRTRISCLANINNQVQKVIVLYNYKKNYLYILYSIDGILYCLVINYFI